MTDRIKHLFPAIILGLIVLAGIVWYMTRVPAPTPTWVTPKEVPVAVEPVKIAEDATYYTVDATYPAQTSLAASASTQADATALATMKTFVEAQIAQFKKDGNFANLTHDDIQMQRLDERKYAISIEYKVHETPATLSYVYQMYVDTGGAHPNTSYQSFTFDKKTGAKLALKDVFVPDAKYLVTLSTLSRTKLATKIATMESVTASEVDTEYIKNGTVPNTDNFQNFYFENGALVLIFPPYQVGPYVLGMIELPIATTELKDLRTQYAH